MGSSQPETISKRDKSIRKSNTVQYHYNEAKGKQTESSDPLISVIVPIYNVEKYVRKCLDSLKTQTLKQIEIICIDDGSTDGSGKIADEYAKEDKRFRVFHTKNRGLSAARNRGIDESRADWLMFVDSDDWVDKDFCRVPWKTRKEYRAEMVIFQYTRTSASGRLKNKASKQQKIGLIDHETAVDIGDSVAWNKLYKKNLFDNIQYPESRVYEDFAVIHKLIYKASTICVLNAPLYYHRMRKGSIERSPSSRIDEYTAKRQQCEELIELGYPKEKAESRLQAASLAYCGHAATTDGKLYEDAARVVENIKGVPEQFGKKQRIMLSVWRMNKSFYRMIYGLLGKRMTLVEGEEK